MPDDSLTRGAHQPAVPAAVPGDGTRAIDWNFSYGQWRAIESLKRFILALAGWQSGKSEIGPPWLLDEMLRMGPGDYLVASPTFPLMLKKVLPIFLRLFDRLGCSSAISSAARTFSCSRMRDAGDSRPRAHSSGACCVVRAAEIPHRRRRQVAAGEHHPGTGGAGDCINDPATQPSSRHIRTVESSLAVANLRPSDDTLIEKMRPRCPVNFCNSLPVATSQT